jgi:tRNA threonylcarbamoyladenosine biosynthesis protein TsaB
MITLAMELSTDCGSLALLDSSQILLEREWREDRLHRQQVFAELEKGLSEDGLDPSQVNLLAVGVGPGAFSGLRMAISAAQALAMPSGQSVYGVTSAEALAWEIMQETGANAVVVLGDARRGEWWAGRFRKGGQWPLQEGGWMVFPEAQLQDRLGEPGTVWVTADWDRIGEGVRALCPGSCSLICERRVPKARYVGLVATARHLAGVMSEEITPVYLHPAVSVAPVF